MRAGWSDVEREVRAMALFKLNESRVPVLTREADGSILCGPACPACGSRRTKRLAKGYPIRQCCKPNCGRSSLYGALVPEKGEA